MNQFFQARLPLVMSAAMAVLLLFSRESINIPWLVQVIAVSCGFAMVCTQLQAITANSPVRKWMWMLLVGTITVSAWYGLNHILAIFVSGCLFLGVHFILGFPGVTAEPPATRAVWYQAFLVGIALLVSPPTVSRIVISLEDLAVPSKFQLHSDPGARLAHHASKSYGSHSFDPIEVNLAANNITLDSPMPWLQFQSRRATRFDIDRIEYRFLHYPILVLGPNQLQQLELDARSDAVVFAPTENGVKIEDITEGESAWIRLPSPVDATSGWDTRVFTALTKSTLWLLICCAYVLWIPTATTRMR